MIYYHVLPRVENYISSYKFLLYSKKHAKETIKMTKELTRINAIYIPNPDFMEKVKNSGIQSECK